MKKCAKYVFLVLVFAIGFLFLDCVGYPVAKEMDLITGVRARSSQILDLLNYGAKDDDFFRQSERIMKSGFLNTDVEGYYGYYQINYEVSRTKTHWGWYSLHVSTMYILSLIGIPTWSEDYMPEARLRIYDSNGTKIKDYQKTGSKFTQTAGLYYGAGDAAITRRAEKELRKLFTDILQMASMQSGEINQALLSAGPVTQEKDSEVRAKMARGGR